MASPITSPPAAPLTDDGGLNSTQKRMIWVLLAVFGTLGLIALAAMLVSGLRQGPPLYPELASPTPPDRLIDTSAETITFRGLNDDPAAYQNKVIEATGEYTPLAPPNCRPFSGPRIEWSLVADSLQLNALGFERILKLVKPGTTMTVVGVWRLYSGPVGCGKEPPDGVVWYLDVIKIIAPNPLFGGPEAVLTFVPGQPTLLAESVPSSITTPDLLPTDGITETATLEVTPPLSMTPGPGATPDATRTELPLTPLATPGDELTPLPTDEGTPPPDATPSSTIDPNATPTTTAAGTTTPDLPTATTPPDGYPEPSPSPTSGTYP